MQKIYCDSDSCAKANFYELDKPIRCGFCGNKFGSSFGSVPDSPPQNPNLHNKIKQVKAKYSPQVEFEEDEEQVEIPQLRGLDIEIEDNRLPKPTVGQIAFTGKEGIKRDKPAKQSKKNALAEIQSWGKADKTPIKIGGE